MSPNQSKAFECVKRVFDFVSALVLLAVFSPILIAAAFAVALNSRGPIFYRQVRTGRNGIPFKIFKFRTMIPNADKLGPLVTSSGDRRTTRIGRVLRKSKIDELPQLINVVLGQMSLVGPRPQVPRYADKFPAQFRDVVLSVRPGITGPTALAFRHEEEILNGREDREAYYFQVLLPVKCRMDADYVSNRSATGDVTVLFQTAALLIRGTFHRILRRPLGKAIDGPVAEEILRVECQLAA